MWSSSKRCIGGGNVDGICLEPGALRPHAVNCWYLVVVS